MGLSGVRFANAIIGVGFANAYYNGAGFVTTLAFSNGFATTGSILANIIFSSFMINVFYAFFDLYYNLAHVVDLGLYAANKVIHVYVN